jgi:hypothetical protein
MAQGSFIQVNSGTGPKLGTGPTYTENSSVNQDEKVILGEQYLAGYIANPNTVGAILTATANSHIFQIMAGSAFKVRIRRIEMYQMAMATTAATMELRLHRLSSAGTGGSAHPPTVLNPADSASGATCMTLPTVKGTETTIVAWASPYMMQTVGASAQLSQPTVVWDFDRLRSGPLIIAAGVANGIAIKNITAIAAATMFFNVWFDESAF